MRTAVIFSIVAYFALGFLALVILGALTYRDSDRRAFKRSTRRDLRSLDEFGRLH